MSGHSSSSSSSSGDCSDCGHSTSNCSDCQDKLCPCNSLICACCKQEFCADCYIAAYQYCSRCTEKHEEECEYCTHIGVNLAQCKVCKCNICQSCINVREVGKLCADCAKEEKVKAPEANSSEPVLKKQKLCK